MNISLNLAVLVGFIIPLSFSIITTELSQFVLRLQDNWKTCNYYIDDAFIFFYTKHAVSVHSCTLSLVIQATIYFSGIIWEKVSFNVVLFFYVLPFYRLF